MEIVFRTYAESFRVLEIFLMRFSLPASYHCKERNASCPTCAELVEVRTIGLAPDYKTYGNKLLFLAFNIKLPPP
jgi:hypothetical protein